MADMKSAAAPGADPIDVEPAEVKPLDEDAKPEAAAEGAEKDSEDAPASARTAKKRPAEVVNAAREKSAGAVNTARRRSTGAVSAAKEKSTAAASAVKEKSTGAAQAAKEKASKVAESFKGESEKPAEAETAPQAAPAASDGKDAKAKGAAGYGWSAYYAEHRNSVIYGIAGAIIGACILIFGFWQMLLVVLLACVGLAYGQYRDGDPRIINFLQRHFGD